MLAKVFLAAVALPLLLVVGVLALGVPEYIDLRQHVKAAPPLESYPPLLVRSVLIAEDPDYLERSAPESVWRTFSPLFTAPISHSASLTNYVARLAITSERPRRMFREVSVYLLAELSLSHESLLASLLGDVPLGEKGGVAIQGVNDAAHEFFGVSVADLSLAQSALIAALIKSPSQYSPSSHPERALERRNKILTEMKARGFLSEDQFNEAVGEVIRVGA